MDLHEMVKKLEDLHKKRNSAYKVDEIECAGDLSEEIWSLVDLIAETFVYPNKDLVWQMSGPETDEDYIHLTLNNSDFIRESFGDFGLYSRYVSRHGGYFSLDCPPPMALNIIITNNMRVEYKYDYVEGNLLDIIADAVAIKNIMDYIRKS